MDAPQKRRTVARIESMFSANFHITNSILSRLKDVVKPLFEDGPNNFTIVFLKGFNV